MLTTAEPTLFPLIQVAGTVVPVSLAIPRHVWANTTTRTVSSQLVSRLTAIVEAAPNFTAATHSSWREVADALCLLLVDSTEEPVTSDVLGKTLLTAEQWGLLKTNKKATGSDRWILTYDAAEALLTDPDQTGVLSALLLQQPFSDTKPHRYNIGLLSFLADCADKGLGSVRVDEVSLVMAPCAKEGPWSPEVEALRKLRGPSGTATPSLADWEKIAGNTKQVKDSIAGAVAAILAEAPANETAADTLIRRHSKDLLPRSRSRRVDDLANRLVPLVLQGDGPTIREAAFQDLLTKVVESHCDFVSTALKLLSWVGLVEAHVEEKGRLYSARYTITDFGRCALEEFPASRAPKTHSAARAAQRSTHASPFPDRSRERAERMTETFVGDASLEGRRYLADCLDWNDYKGTGRAHEFEWCVVRSVFAVTEAHADHDLASGVHTKLNNALEAVHHAPGGNADGWIRTARGRKVLIEVTGVTGPAQVGHELEPVVRHLRNAVREDQSATSLFVAPEVSTDMAAYLLIAATGDHEVEVPQAPIVPLTAAQLETLLLSEVSFHDLLEELVSLIVVASAQPTLPAARKLLSDIAATIERSCTADPAAGSARF